MKNRIILYFMLLFIAHNQAQEQKTMTLPRLRLGIEVGMNVLPGKINKPDLIRENQSYYRDVDDDFYCGFIPEDREFVFFNFGIKPEYSLNKRFAVAAGLRFNFNQVVLNSDKNYFLWKVSENETTANYVKIETISQKNYFVGIPIEIRFFPNEKDYFVRHYFIIGTALNFCVASINEVEFQNPAMEKYSSNILTKIGKPTVFQGYLYGGIGLKIGKMHQPFGNVEVHLPVLMFGNNKPSSLVNIINGLGVGFRATLHIPIFAEHQLTYTVTD